MHSLKALQLRLRIALDTLLKINRLAPSVERDDPNYVDRLRVAVATAF